MQKKTNHSSSSEQALKQFSLETARVEWIYQNLEAHFTHIQQNMKDLHIRIGGKLAELNFVTKYLETILNHISQGIIFIDIHGIVTTYNAAAQKILAISENDLLLHPFENFFSDDFFGFSLKEAFRSQLCPKISFLAWTRPDGKKFELEIEASFLALNADKTSFDYREAPVSSIQGLLLLIRNLTELRQLQLMVNRHDLLKELGEMAAQLAHEIRNPLGGIKGFATLLHQDLQDKPDLQLMAGHIIEGTDNLNRLVSAILHYTRTFQLQLEVVDLVLFCEELKLFMQADLSWNPQIDLQIQPLKTPLLVPVDRQLFRSALLNLLVNATQAMSEGGKLTVSLDKTEDEAIIQVIDTGKGIEKEHLNKLFSPFFTTKETGTGLGLAEVQKVVQAHGGWIGVQSELGQGSCFTIKLPLKNKE